MQPEQLKFPRLAIMSQEKTNLIDQEIREMRSKGTISKKSEGSVLSSLFYREKIWEKPSIDQNERIEQNGPLCTLQGERSVSFERNATASGLYVQD